MLQDNCLDVTSVNALLPAASPSAATIPPLVPCAIDLAIIKKFDGPGEIFSSKAAAVNARSISVDGMFFLYNLSALPGA